MRGLPFTVKDSKMCLKYLKSMISSLQFLAFLKNIDNIQCCFIFRPFATLNTESDGSMRGG